jgi:hypothetical protein
MVGIASAFDFDPEAEPGDLALSAPKVQFLRDYIADMSLRARAWTLEKADTQAADELKRAIERIKATIETFQEEKSQDSEEQL